ncbi:hypothetical protein T01_15540 [Trichinella spiralis]|uniref:Uncharacterized protein n=1 Tax=Trichinella spiralis TaxID=6334 RepID=A0A0V1BMH6_TRISP|nr:hypothetical protein T01_15540 [Trichinella spiralis]
MEIDIGSEFTIVMHTFSKDSRFSSYVWWPKLDGEIEILNSVVLHRLCIDIAGRICGKNFLIIVDTFFTWLEEYLNKGGTKHIILAPFYPASNGSPWKPASAVSPTGPKTVNCGEDP